MKLKEFSILLDIKKQKKNDYFEVVQGDIDTNALNITLENGAYPYDLYDLNVEIIFKKSDGTTVQQTEQTGIEIINAVQGQIRCVLKTNTIACPGKVVAEVKVLEQGKLLTSALFSFHVRKSLITDETIESTNEFPILTQLMNEVNDLIDVVEGIEQQVPDNVVKAIGVLQQLTTTNKDSLVNAINELNSIKFDKANIANNGVTTATGFALDARYGKKLADDVNVLSNNLPNIGYTNEGIKNSIYRGKNLGSAVTAKQYADIANGSFTDLYIGDYWTIGGVNWRISAFNYYRNTGDTNVPGNHIVIVPDQSLYNHVMNDTNKTEGGYTGSKMYTEGLEQAKTTIRGIFGTHLLKHRQILSNVTAGGKASGWAWMDSEVGLMNEIMVYGSIVWGESTIGGSGYNIGVNKSQLPLFALNPRMIDTRQNYWLRDVVSAADFAYVSSYGFANGSNASGVGGVRPAFSIS